MPENRIVLVIGGARSGKSSLAEKIAREAGPRRFYIATAPASDDEMRLRIARHQAQRAADGWTTIEELTGLESALAKAAENRADAVLVDCLTLWINNLIYFKKIDSESAMAERAEKLVGSIRKTPCAVVLVINEVGLGLVPDSREGRLFRDCSGRCAQIMAAAAHEVRFTVAGLEWRLK